MKYLNHRIKIKTVDKRIFEGDLINSDNKMNLIINDTEEFRKGVPERRRYLGLILMRSEFINEMEIICKNLN